jgi:tRNA (guanine26-N2/guanine27-N2)-dimethyltransferase
MHPPGTITEGLASVLPIETNEVFYNPVQVFNRDLSILAVSVFAREVVEGGLLAPRRNPLPKSPEPSFHVLEGLAASGLRSVRYAKELKFAQFSFVANDIEAVAVERIQKNIEYNNLSNAANISTVNADAVIHMHMNKHVYDVIDLDPYGSVSIFLDSALSSVRPNGLLCITSTDGGVLCGNQIDMSFMRYGGFSLKKDFCHETGIRVLLHAIHTAAARHKRAIRVLAAFSIDFYFRVFIQVIDAPAIALESSVINTGILLQCTRCEFHHIQAIGRLEGQLKKPARLLLPSSSCPECLSGQFAIGGPMWIGPIYDELFIEKCIDVVENEKIEFEGISSWAKINGLLYGLRGELVDIPLFYSLPAITQSIKCSPPKLRFVQYFLRALGYRVGGSHRQTNVVKTDAPARVVFDLIRLFVQQTGLVIKNPLVPELLSQPITTEFSHEIDFTLADVPSETREVAIHLPNPKAFWGPKPMAKRAREEKSEKE